MRPLSLLVSVILVALYGLALFSPGPTPSCSAGRPAEPELVRGHRRSSALVDWHRVGVLIAATVATVVVSELPGSLEMVIDAWDYPHSSG